MIGMTISEILASKEPMLTAADIAEIIGSDPATIRLTVQQDREALEPLGPIRTGNRVKFPRERFIWWYYGRSSSEISTGPCSDS